MIIKVKLQDGASAHYNFQISEAATFAALHEECVRHANELCSGYTVENTKLELGGTLERYRAVLPTDELVLKLVDPKKTVCNHKLFAASKRLGLSAAT
jgi:hypothetical protein